MGYNEIFRDRTKKLAVDTIKMLSGIAYSDAVSVIRKQLIRSVTSVAANYRAVGRARSDQERYAKLCIVVEEIDETLFWLEIIEELRLALDEELEPLQKEAEEILKATASYRKRLSSKD